MFGSVSQDTITNYPENYKKVKTLTKTQSRKEMLKKAKLGEIVHSLRTVDAVQKRFKSDIDAIRKNPAMTSKEKSSKIAAINQKRSHVNATSKRASLHCERNVCNVKSVWCKKGYKKDSQMNCVKRPVSATPLQKKPVAPIPAPKQDEEKPVAPIPAPKQDEEKPVAPIPAPKQDEEKMCPTFISKPRCVMNSRTKLVQMSVQNDCKLKQDNDVVANNYSLMKTSDGYSCQPNTKSREDTAICPMILGLPKCLEQNGEPVFSNHNQCELNNMMKREPSIRVSQTHIPHMTSTGRYECIARPNTTDHTRSVVNSNLPTQSEKTTSVLRRMKLDKENALFQKTAADVFNDELIKLIESASDKQLEDKAKTTKSLILSRLPTDAKREFIKTMIMTTSGGGTMVDTAGTFALILAQRGLERYLKTSNKGRAPSLVKNRNTSVVRRLRTIA